MAASGEPTEEPTQKRLEEARGRGEVAQSRDLVSAAAMTAALLALVAGGPESVARLVAYWRGALAAAPAGGAPADALLAGTGVLARALALPLAAAAAARAGVGDAADARAGGAGGGQARPRPPLAGRGAQAGVRRAGGAAGRKGAAQGRRWSACWPGSPCGRCWAGLAALAGAAPARSLAVLGVAGLAAGAAGGAGGAGAGRGRLPLRLPPAPARADDDPRGGQAGEQGVRGGSRATAPSASGCTASSWSNEWWPRSEKRTSSWSIPITSRWRCATTVTATPRRSSSPAASASWPSGSSRWRARPGVPIFRDVTLARSLRGLPEGEEIPAALYEAVAEVLRVVYGDGRAGCRPPVARAGERAARRFPVARAGSGLKMARAMSSNDEGSQGGAAGRRPRDAVSPRRPRRCPRRCCRSSTSPASRSSSRSAWRRGSRRSSSSPRAASRRSRTTSIARPSWRRCSSGAGKTEDLARVQQADRAGAVRRRCARGGARPRPRRAVRARGRRRRAVRGAAGRRSARRAGARRSGQLIDVYERRGTGRDRAQGGAGRSRSTCTASSTATRDGARGLQDQQAGREAGAGDGAVAAGGHRALRAAAGDLRDPGGRRRPGAAARSSSPTALATLCARRGLYGLEVEGRALRRRRPRRLRAGDGALRAAPRRHRATTCARAEGSDEAAGASDGRRRSTGALLEVAVALPVPGTFTYRDPRPGAPAPLGDAGGGPVRRAHGDRLRGRRPAPPRRAASRPRTIEEVVGGRAGVRRGDDRASAAGRPTTTRRRSARCCARRCRRGSRRPPSARVRLTDAGRRALERQGTLIARRAPATRCWRAGRRGRRAAAGGACSSWRRGRAGALRAAGGRRGWSRSATRCERRRPPPTLALAVSRRPAIRRRRCQARGGRGGRRWRKLAAAGADGVAGRRR